MGSLAGKSPANTYKSLLKVADETNGVSHLLVYLLATIILK